MRAILIFSFVLALIAADVVMTTTSAGTIVEDGPAPLALFCAKDACAATLALLINKAGSISCAFYDLDHPDVIAALAESIERGNDARIVLDDRSANDPSQPDVRPRHVRIDGDDGQMHNKFCIFDERVVWTGSMNPTIRGDGQNDNNVVVIASRGIAARFLEEFDELWSGTFRGGRRTKKSTVQDGNATIQMLFCPEDHCADEVADVLAHANRTILFMAFSFTHHGIADALVDAHDRGVRVQGVVERSGNQQISMYGPLRDAGIEVRYDGNPAMMHHKVFIIDERVVITGSFNPTYNGDARNDENLLIIENTPLAAHFEEEFGRVLEETSY